MMNRYIKWISFSSLSCRNTQSVQMSGIHWRIDLGIERRRKGRGWGKGANSTLNVANTVYLSYQNYRKLWKLVLRNSAAVNRDFLV